MSTPSSSAPNGQRQRPPSTVNQRSKPVANPLRPIKRRPANPLVASKSAPSSRPADPTVGNSQLGLKVDGEASVAAKLERLRSQYGGWSEPPPSSGYRDIPVVTTAKALREGTRYHVMRFPQPTGPGDKGAIDPTDQNSFTRPVLLHRRDPRQPPPGYVSKRQKKESTPEEEAADDKEAERLEQVKAEREAQKAADQAKIAPTVKEMISKRPRKPKDDQVVANRMPKTEKGRKEAALRYEEALPWHLEDVDGKNVLAGRYVAALSEANVALVFDGSKYRMIPLEKWYRFTQKPPYQSDGEDNETGDKRKKEAPLAGWMTRTLKKREEENESKLEFRNSGKRLGPARAPAYADDVRGDEIDMEGDEFDDDDENTGFDHDEDTKISNARIRQEQLGANLFGDADENEVDAEEERKLRRELERKLASKKLKKTLKKRENVDDVESDESGSSEDPFAESSVSFCALWLLCVEIHHLDTNLRARVTMMKMKRRINRKLRLRTMRKQRPKRIRVHLAQAKKALRHPLAGSKPIWPRKSRISSDPARPLIPSQAAMNQCSGRKQRKTLPQLLDPVVRPPPCHRGRAFRARPARGGR